MHLIFYLALGAAAAQTHPLTIDDILAIPRVSNVQVSPDGQKIAFVVDRVDVAANKSYSTLMLIAASGGEPQALIGGMSIGAGKEKIASYRFSPDGKTIAFVSNRSGTSQVYLMSASGGEPKAAPPIASEVDEILFWTPDAKSLLVTSDVDPACGADMGCNAQKEKAAQGKPHVATRLLYRHWNTWRDRKRTHVLKLPLEGGGAVDLTPGDRDVPPDHRGGANDFALSADGQSLLFVAISDKVEAISTNGDIYSVPLTGGALRQITTAPGWDGAPLPSPDGKWLAWRSQARAGYEADRERLMLGAPNGEKPIDLTAKFELNVSRAFWAADSQKIYFTADQAGRHQLFEVSVKGGAVKQLTKGLDLAEIAAQKSTVAALVDSLSAPPEVAVVQNGQVKVLTHITREAMGAVRLGQVQPLEAKGKDGAPIHGFVLLPPGHRAGEKHPGVVLIHGGPQSNWRDAWNTRWNAQAYAAPGYAVVMPNPRGSTGYGQAYTDVVRNNWGGTPYDDIMALTDAAIATGAFDDSRMCAAGASYGGYMINWINGHTKRFKCLVAHAGDFNVEGSYYDTEELWFPEWDLGAPWKDPAAYAKWSPHMYVKEWSTPTLVTHGELDYRVNFAHGVSTFTALQRLGVESKLVVFSDEGHWILKPQNSKAFYEHVLDWLAAHLKTKAESPAPRASSK